MSACGGRVGALPLTVRGLRVVFGATVAVDGLDLDVQAGAVVGLVGPNGCGKTTTLRATLGLVEAAAGSVLVAGFAGGSREARAAASCVPDEPAGFEELTPVEYSDLVGALWHADADYRRRRDALVAAFGLERSKERRLCALSHGRRRLVALVAAAALRPRLLLVDEATAALDPEAVISLRAVLRESAAEGAGVLLATQDLGFAGRACDRLVVLREGRCVADAEPEALVRRFGAGSLEEAFAAAVGLGARGEEIRRALAAR
jgi:ABC-type multidrug transport system ATPase subunit